MIVRKLPLLVLPLLLFAVKMLDLPAAELVIFGNPQLGTPAMQDDIAAGLFLPLKILVHAGPDGTVVAFEPVVETFAGLGLRIDF